MTISPAIAQETRQFPLENYSMGDWRIRQPECHRMTVSCPNSPSFELELTGKREKCFRFPGHWVFRTAENYAEDRWLAPICRSTGAAPVTTGADFEWVVRQGQVEVGRFWVHDEGR